jgi:E3 ubiquitin-protein ligase MUL1
MKTPLPYIIIFGMSTPFVILAIAFANGWIKVPIRCLNLLTDIALSFDGAILGLTLAVSAVGSALKYASTNAALKKIKDAPEVSISDLRSLLPASEDKSETNDNRKSNDQRIVVVRGVVKPKISGDEGYKNNNVLISPETGDKALIIQRTQTVRCSKP